VSQSDTGALKNAGLTASIVDNDILMEIYLHVEIASI
jgi:hypothetical protein